MKKISFFIFLVVVILSNLIGYTFAQSTPFDDTKAIAMLKEFYKEYVTEMSTTADESTLAKIEKKYCTSKLVSQLPRLSDKCECDPLIKAQDSNLDDLSTLTVNIYSSSQHYYIIDFIDLHSPNYTHKIIYAFVLLEKNNTYRIDNVW